MQRGAPVTAPKRACTTPERIEQVFGIVRDAETWVGSAFVAMRAGTNTQGALDALGVLVGDGRVVRRQVKTQAFSRTVMYATPEIASTVPMPRVERPRGR